MPHSADRVLSKARIAFVAVFYLPSAFAEVVDKVPNLSFIWGGYRFGCHLFGSHVFPAVAFNIDGFSCCMVLEPVS